ncbi:MAG: thioredoxin family protein [Phycisphaerales bacterium]|nr:thioredoxin family protein [Phycisphaerales bacterium]
MRLRSADLATIWPQALAWPDYLASDEDKAQAWTRTAETITLTTPQRALLAGFTRQIRVLMVSGIWCGDCVRQGPIAQAIAEAAPGVELRFIDRDHPASPIGAMRINDGERVPVTLFMAEDFEPVQLLGDRTLQYYRHMAAQQIGAACPVPGAGLPEDVQNGVIQDWIDATERVHLLLRLSNRLRQRHGD